jgi:flagellar secretion chaperone FliS
MAVDELRARYMRDRVMTASPAQRVVMLYDRLGLDLTLAQAGMADDPFAAGAHLSHAMQIVAELQSSLDISAGGPAVNLSSIYGFVMNEIITIRGGDHARLPGIATIVATLRDAWAQAAEQLANEPTAQAAAGAWVG